MAVKQFGKGDEQDKKKGAGRRVDREGRADWRGFINLNLTDEEKAGVDAWAEGDTFWECLDLQVTSGVEISVKPDSRGQGFQGSATQRALSSVNAGLCVTARGRTPSAALVRVVYSLAILSRTERWEDTQKVADPDRW